LNGEFARPAGRPTDRPRGRLVPPRYSQLFRRVKPQVRRWRTDGRRPYGDGLAGRDARHRHRHLSQGPPGGIPVIQVIPVIPAVNVAAACAGVISSTNRDSASRHE
jgi:hypothetical protein